MDQPLDSLTVVMSNNKTLDLLSNKQLVLLAQTFMQEVELVNSINVNRAEDDELRPPLLATVERRS